MRFLELKVPPVLQVLVVAVAMRAVAIATPNFSFAISSEMAIAVKSALAACFFVVGLAIALLGVREFRRASTTVDPRFPETTTRLLATGIYRFSRNPMYLGFLLLLLGWAVYLQSYAAFLLIPVFVISINRLQIQPEERYLMQKFGKKYGAYAGKVRRWI